MLTAAAVVVCALNVLGRSPASTVPIRFLDAPPAIASRNAEGFITRNPDAIYLVTSTAAFRTAQRGYHEPGAVNACRHLAGVIVHEEWHLRHGDDEEGAYLAQMTTLAALGADSASIAAVRKSMLFVIDREKGRRRQAELTVARW
jgi:hypothetical protein